MTESVNDDPTPLQANLVERVNVGDIIARTADVHPQAIALVDGEFDRQPKVIVFVTEVPRTGTGKVQQHPIRGELGSHYSHYTP